MVIQHNLSALNTNRNAGIIGRASSKSIEKLSSGYKVNRAADDAASLSISEKMRKQIRGMNQASLNAEDGVSLIQIAEGGMVEVHDMLQRMHELSIQAATGTYSDKDRGFIQDEINQLTTEIDRVASTTEFNELSLIDGSLSAFGSSARNSDISSLSTNDKIISYLYGTWLNDAAKKIESLTGWKLPDGIELTVKFDSSIDPATMACSGGFGGKSFTLAINEDDYKNMSFDSLSGSEVGGHLTDQTVTHELTHLYTMACSQSANTTGAPLWFMEGIAEATCGDSFRIGEGSNPVDVFCYAMKNTFLNFYSGNSNDAYSGGYVAVNYMRTKMGESGFKQMLADLKTKSWDDAVKDNSSWTSMNDVANSLKTEFGSTITSALTLSATNKSGAESLITNWLQTNCNINITDGLCDDLDNDDATKENIIPNSGTPEVPSGNNVNVKLGSSSVLVKDWGTDTDFSLKKKFSPGSLTLQVGAEKGNSFRFTVDAVTSKGLHIDGISVETQADATAAIDVYTHAIQQVSSIRSKLGAIQNGLEATIRNLDNTSENLVASESQIRDTDMAREMVNYSNQNILKQASQSMLAQTNTSQNSVLMLLR